MERKYRGKLEEVVKVNCLGSRHRVGLSESGRLILFDHPKGDEDEVAALLLFNPEFRCRCHEIRDVWRWYTRDRCSPGWYELKDREEFAWILTVFQNSWGGFEAPTDSRLLAQLPKALRAYAKEASNRRHRINRTYWGRKPPAYWKRYESTYQRNARLLELRERKMKRHLLKNSVVFRKNKELAADITVDQIRVCHFIDGQAIVYDHNLWFKACLDIGIIPLSFPPHNVWTHTEWDRERYPPMIFGGVLTAESNRYGEFSTHKKWIGIQWDPKTRNYLISIGD